MSTAPQSVPEVLRDLQASLETQQQAIHQLQQDSALVELNIDQLDEESEALTERVSTHGEILGLVVNMIREQRQLVDLACKRLSSSIDLQNSMGNAVLTLWALLPERERLMANEKFHELEEGDKDD